MRNWLTGMAMVAVAAIAGWALVRQLHGLDWAAVLVALGSLAPWRYAVGIALLVASLLAYAVFERLATAHLGRPLVAGRCIATALAAQGISLSTGKGPLVAGLVRIRLLGRWGYDLPQAVGATLVASLHGNAGIAALLVVVLAINRPWPWALPAAAALAAGLALWLAIGWRRWTGELYGRRISAPSLRDQLIGIVAGMGEKLACGLLAWVLMPGDIGLGLGVFLATVLVSLVAARVSQVPGGLGVLEASIIGLWPGGVGEQRTTVVAGLLAFRIAYYLVPLVPGLAVLAWLGWRRSIAPCATASSSPPPTVADCTG